MEGFHRFPPQENLNRRSTNGRISIKSRRRVSAAEQLSRGHISSIVATIIVSPPTFSLVHLFDVLPLDGQVIFSNNPRKAIVTIGKKSVLGDYRLTSIQTRPISK